MAVDCFIGYPLTSVSSLGQFNFFRETSSSLLPGKHKAGCWWEWRMGWYRGDRGVEVFFF